MLRLLFIAPAFVLISLIVCDALQLRAHWAYRHAVAAASEPVLGTGREDIKPRRPAAGAFARLPKVEQAQALSLARSASAMLFAPVESHLHVVSLLSKVLEATADPEKKLRLYCESLSQLGQALSKDKLNARLMVRWANLRQLLSDLDCEEPYTRGNFQTVVAQALLLSPADVQVQYAAGLILLWAGEKSAAFQLFREVLSLATNLAPTQESFIFSNVSDAPSLRALLPPRFPQVQRFSHYFKTYFAARTSDEEREELLHELSFMQINAIKESIASFEAGRLPLEMHFNRLMSLLSVTADGGARAELDKELSHLLARRGEEGLARYFMERSRLQELKIVACESAGDTRPLKSNLANWGFKQTVFLDEFFRSLGFYLAPGQAPRVIELNSVNERATGARLPLKVFYSDDNQKWSEAPLDSEPEQFDLLGHTIVALRLPREYHKYWKVSYASAVREKTFGLELGSGFKVYGVSLEDAQRAK